LDARSHREDSAGSPDTQSLVLDSICYTKRFRIAQGGNKKSYRRVRNAILDLVERQASSPVPRIVSAVCGIIGVWPTFAPEGRIAGFQIPHRRLRTDTRSRTRILDPGLGWYRRRLET